MAGYLVGEVPKMGRKLRKPQHSFHLRQRAFQIQPMMLAPVLAGETLKNLLFQARVVTDPIKNPFIGWWQEYYFFYIKLSDLDFADDTSLGNPGSGLGSRVQMLLADPAFNATSYDYGSANVPHYAVALSQTYMRDCLTLVTSHYFRDERDVETTYELDGLPLAMINNTGILDSAMLNDDYMRAQTNVDVDLLGDASDAELKVSEIENALNRYKLAKANGLTDATWEDYLASFGLNTALPEKPHRPELVRYVRQWQYPSNTVEPSTGVPSSAVSWSIQERGDKDRFFREPGFLMGLSVTRPKVYLSNQKAYMSGFLDRAEDWMPAWLWGEPLTSMKKYAQGTGPFSGLTDADGYWIDMRDLFMYGDQFVNFALTETDAGLVALPTVDLQKKFVSDTDVDGLFVTPATKQWIRQDGVVNLTIASTLRDTTPTT